MILSSSSVTVLTLSSWSTITSRVLSPEIEPTMWFRLSVSIASPAAPEQPQPEETGGKDGLLADYLALVEKEKAATQK